MGATKKGGGIPCMATVTHMTDLQRLFSRCTCRNNARTCAVATAHKQLPNLTSEHHPLEVLLRRSAGSSKCALAAE